jgi:hypothetical protein
MPLASFDYCSSTTAGEYSLRVNSFMKTRPASGAAKSLAPIPRTILNGAAGNPNK